MIRVLTIIFLVLFAPLANAQEKIGIVATVGDEAITNLDLINRMKITIISSGLDSSPEVIQRIKPKVLQSLINEKIQASEAKNLGYDVSQEEIDNALGSVEAQNKMPTGALKQLLDGNQIPLSTMVDQIRGEISWAKIRSKHIQPRVIIGEEEVDDFLNAQSLSSVRTEYYLNEIVLPVDSTEEEKDALELAKKLKSQIESGKDFTAIAQEFSQSATARSGGKVGWLSENQIPKELLEGMKNDAGVVELNKVTDPIRSIEGYFLILAEKTREVESNADRHYVNMRQFTLAPKNPKKESSVKAAFEKMAKLNDSTSACIRSEGYAKKNNTKLTDFGEVRIRDLSPGVKNVVVMLETGVISSPVRSPNGVSVFIVCEKIQDTFQQFDEEERGKARNFLHQRKLELLSRKFMRDLRSRTNIETRL